ncbi:peptidoglycan recognition protein [Actinoplanes sp. NPDC048988]|uniref:peptidoglycan recognition protein family protein n=1 Tax=Actinoplanes sp. NPDC048988 TaxID=3363901 RepID=UPI003720CDC7
MHRNRTNTRAATALLTIVAGTLIPRSTAAAEPAAPPELQTVTLSGAAADRPQTSPFSLLGATWSDPAARLNGGVRVRTRAIATGRWSPWQTLEADSVSPADRRGSTDPLWVGPSNGLEARVVGTHGPLPADLRVDLFNPDAGGAATSPPTTSAPTAPISARAAVTIPVRPVPRMVLRGQWGADESIVRGKPEYTGAVQEFFVHHTATGNNYSCSQSASIIRGIQAYHVRSRGWDDIGYNFLVDKCGTIFEGRGGGVQMPVLGAHTMGFNTDASAVAAIGTYGGSGVSATVRRAIATVAAYKLGAAGNLPSGRVVLTSGGSNRYPAGARVEMWRISGHRDAGRTDCPGDALYRQLPAIRAIAGGAPAGFRLLGMGGTWPYGGMWFTKGTITPRWDTRTASALINRFEIYVDGVLAAAVPGTHRTTTLTVSPGKHAVSVRALHLSGRVAGITTTVYADAVAPVFDKEPDLVLRPGTIGATVPVRLDWKAGDPGGLIYVGLTKPTRTNLLTTTTSRNLAVRAGVPATYAIVAGDRARNTVNASVTRTPVVLSEAASQRTGTWRLLNNPAYLGGTALGASTAGSSASWTFSGSSVALAFSRGSKAGRVRVFVDGQAQGTVDLKATGPLNRQAVWSRWWAGSSEHTVRVEVEGTTGRPGVAIDGLVYLK